MEDFMIWWCGLLGVTDPFTVKLATAAVVATPLVFVLVGALNILSALLSVIIVHVWGNQR
jgi:hypothetical protein